jgi:predicted outer membrane repeat protein
MSWDLVARRSRRDMAVLVTVALMGMLALAQSAQSAQAANFTVSDGNDAPLASSTGTTCVSTEPAGGCTLRAAIQAADNLGGASTITLQPGAYSLSVPAASGASPTDDPASGDLDIEETNGAATQPQITVTAVPGSNDAGATTIDAAHVDRVFTVHASTSLTVDGITIKNGSQPGGAVASDRSYMATEGGAILGDGSLTVENSVVRDNSAGNEGGAVYAYGDLTIENSTFTGDQATLGGGAIAYAGDGTSTLNLTDDTIALNQAGSRGGGVGFFTNSVTTAGVIRNVTIVGNTAPDGGGLYQPTKVGTIENSIIAENSGSPAMGGADDCFESFGGDNADEAGAADHGGNIDSDGSCFSASTAHDLTSSDPNVGQLADNGGPTATAALPAGSPAIGLAIAADCPTTDQRGAARLASFCDAGAFQSVDADCSEKPPARIPDRPGRA